MSKKQPKWYVVWEGRKPGIYTTWADCERQVKGVPGARFKSFPSEAEAEAAYGRPVQATKGNPSRQRASPSTAGELAPVEVEIFCDGACDPNPGPAGSGLALYRRGKLASLHYGHYTPKGTNNTAELHALHEALKLAQAALASGESVRIRADSLYAIKCVSLWASKWKKRGWKRSGGVPVKNPEIIEVAHLLYEQLAGKVELAHVKGHAGVEGNELADRMAMLAATEKQSGFVAYAGELDIGTVLSFKRG